jgi:hypothetical protein
MKLRDYIMLFNDHCSFFELITKSGKWIFFVERGGDTRKKLIDAVMKVDELSKLKINGVQDVTIKHCGDNVFKFIISFK